VRRSTWPIACLAFLLLVGCQGSPNKAPNPVPLPDVQATLPPPPPPVRARILAVGDLLMHLPLVTASATADGDWDFKPLFAPVQPWIAGADLAIANLETTLTGKGYPWAGYPGFNTPQEFARDVKAIGFDVLTNANNHQLDFGEFGLKETSGALERYGVSHTGTARTQDERDKILVVDSAPGVRMAVLAYTYGTNGIPLPHPWSVNLLDPDQIQADVRRARALPGVDLVAVALHMGTEYDRAPNEEQQRYVQLTLEAGADIILGDHPHVIQKIEVRQVKDEFGRDLPRAIIFSEGNFIHLQHGLGLPMEEGLMLLIDVKKEHDVTSVERVSFVPTWVHRYWAGGKRYFRVLVVEEAMHAYETKTDPLISIDDYRRLQEVWLDVKAHAPGTPDVQLWHYDQPIKP
jgi:hypothetical protein